MWRRRRRRRTRMTTRTRKSRRRRWRGIEREGGREKAREMGRVRERSGESG